MKVGLYAGSFDPWSIGHQYVLENALDVFDAMHVLVAVHPSKQSRLDADARARLTAHTSDPTKNWWDLSLKQPFVLKEKRLTVSTSEGLVAEYAHKNNIQHLVRGMRSTTDFEAEFNLYFANNAIDSKIQTWAIMCPPRLIHCSSTYIRAVVGKAFVKNVGTSFAAQSIMLNYPVILGQLFDIYLHALKSENSKCNLEEVLAELQRKFFSVTQKKLDQNLLVTLQSNIFNQKALQESKVYLELIQKL